MFQNVRERLSRFREKEVWLSGLITVVAAFVLILPQVLTQGVIAGSDFLADKDGQFQLLYFAIWLLQFGPHC